MRRLAVRLAYFGRTALRGLLASPVTSSVAILTIAVALVLLGSFALVVQNMQELLDRFADELRVTAWLEQGLPPDAQRELAERVRSVEGVAEVRAVSAAEALERFRRGVGRGSVLLEGLSENPLPASLEIALAPGWRSAEGLAVVAGALDGLPGVAELGSAHDWVEGYLRAIALLRGLGLGLGGVLALATVLIVANTIRLAVFSRREELEILALVGASRGFVRTPFLLEGALQGAAGAVLALGVLYGLFRLVLPGFEFGLELVLGGAAPRYFDLREAAALLAGGAGLGLFGSALAVSAAWKS